MTNKTLYSDVQKLNKAFHKLYREVLKSLQKIKIVQMIFKQL